MYVEILYVSYMLIIWKYVLYVYLMIYVMRTRHGSICVEMYLHDNNNRSIINEKINVC